jgi:hypothetical protein
MAMGSVAFCTVFTPPHCFSLMSAVPVPASLLEDAPKGFARKSETPTSTASSDAPFSHDEEAA